MTPATPASPYEVAAIVLAGGRSSRLPPDKLAAELGDGTVLDATLSGLPEDLTIICVGPSIETRRAVSWVRESPPLGGPLAGVEAGLSAVPDEADVVLVVAGDLPAAGRAVPDLLHTVQGKADGTTVAVAVVRDSTGRLQPLLAAWSRAALADTVAALQPTSGRAAAAMLVSARLNLSLREVPDLWGASQDIDDLDDLDAARGRRRT